MKINDLILAADYAIEQWHKSADVFGAMQRLRFESEKAKKLMTIEQEPQEAWSGDGLPPVGSNLEVTFGNKSIWHECVVLPNKKIAIDRYAGWHVMGWQDDFEFRPLKTERERAIEAMRELCAQVEKTLTPPAYGKTPEEREKLHKEGFEKMMGAAFDAGLLKLPEQQK